MMRLVLPLCLACATAAAASTDAPVQPRAALGEGEARATRPVAGLRLPQYERGEFLEHRAALADAVSAPDAPEARLHGAALDLAALYLSHVMLHEARSVLDALDPQALPSSQADRWRALDAVHAVLAPGGTLPGSEAFAGWPEAALWRAVRHLRAGNDAQLATLEEVVAQIDALPTALAEYLLPDLLEAAIEAEAWAPARDLAARMEAIPALQAAPSYRFLLGQAAESGGQLVAAFDSYVAAAQEAGVFAQRARLALVELGRRTGALSPREAREILDLSRTLWRGDVHALHALREIVEIDLELGNTVSALEVLAQIGRDFPDSEAAALARQQARALMEDYYGRGAEGEMPLTEFLAGHQRIAVDYRFDQTFAAQGERFADRFRAAGATAVAAREYGLVHDYLAAASALGLQDVPVARLDALRLKRAEALIDGGRYAEAAALLDRAITAPGLRDRWNHLKARASAEAGEVDGVLATKMARPSPDYLRLMAEARFAREEWAAAQDHYAALWRTLGAGLPFEDAVNLLLSAHRAGDADLAAEVAEAFPDAAQSRRWSEVAADLSGTVPGVLPLRAQTARDRVARAERTLEALGELEAGASE
ncbi:hypothetical protein SAMN04488047_11045 [Tranquillimonas alkanivorans]|uniref:Tetratricopeptide repeat-containing protein n=1 Tax=Tranquillimonas alkanivorans TaxID=441119 RepID=A0A1I5S554_9RHOB|nr:hypothetical protein SAMN04488047_11045 [Tranquillimonas alkanivorans]